MNTARKRETFGPAEGAVKIRAPQDQPQFANKGYVGIG